MVKDLDALFKRVEEAAIDIPGKVIVWDTETTGFHPGKGEDRHRLVEIGAIEVENGKPTGRVFHQYINPERPVPPQATKVHGLTDEFLKDKPTFTQIAQQFSDFVGDLPLVAHNAPFDMRFINAELEWDGREPISHDRMIDSLSLAKAVLPNMKSYSLDALADHFDVDRSGRDDHHGGLVDTEILVGVYKHLVKLAQEKAVPLRDAGGDLDPALAEQLDAEREETLQQEKLERYGPAPLKGVESPMTDAVNASRKHASHGGPAL